MGKTGCRIRVLSGAGAGHLGTILTEPVSGTAKGELVVQVKLDGQLASATFRLSDLEQTE